MNTEKNLSIKTTLKATKERRKNLHLVVKTLNEGKKVHLLKEASPLRNIEDFKTLVENKPLLINSLLVDKQVSSLKQETTAC